MLGCEMVGRLRSLGMIEVFSELDSLIGALKIVNGGGNRVGVKLARLLPRSDKDDDISIGFRLRAGPPLCRCAACRLAGVYNLLTYRTFSKEQIYGRMNMFNGAFELSKLPPFM